MSNVTSSSDPTLHAKLSILYYDEGRPTIVANGSAHYFVVHATNGELEFAPKSSEELHDSTSNFPGKK